MKKNIEYFCEKCDEQFNDETECQQHEENCNPIVEFVCDKCGTKKEWDKNYNRAFSYEEECHYIDLGRPGYGSGLDGCDVKFQLCDDCLINFIKSFTIEGQEKVFNSGSNAYLDPEDWIRVEKGEMPDEEMEEKGMYSPRQIKAYEERYPVCDKVRIIEYNDGVRGSRCTYGAFGGGDGECDVNICEECFECVHFKAREEGHGIPIETDL